MASGGAQAVQSKRQCVHGTILYPRHEVALGHGAGVEQDTPSPQEAYSPFPHWRLGRPDQWAELPWGR